jgi:HEAT repeat protein
MQALIKVVIIISTFVGNVTQEQTPVAPPLQFIPVEGTNLRARLDNSIKQGQSRATRFWTAYSFDVRSGVAIDAETYHNSGTFWVNGVSIGSNIETRNLAVFLLHEPSGSAIPRLEIYNLERKREYSGYPVYWLGRANNEESLTLLKGLVDNQSEERLRDRATQAIALHDEKSVGAILKTLTQKSNPEKVRKTALFWLGHVEGEREFLADIVRNEQESIEVRKQAAFGLGVNKDRAALPTLQTLYASVTPRELKRQLIFATSINENKDTAVDFLINVATNDPDRELKKQAMFWLGQKADDRSLKFLSDVIEKTDGDAEVQKQAVFAIGQRHKDEAIPLLIKVAKTHPNLAVRKQAIFWLGQSSDERALAFFKEIFAR